MSCHEQPENIGQHARGVQIAALAINPGHQRREHQREEPESAVGPPHVARRAQRAGRQRQHDAALQCDPPGGENASGASIAVGHRLPPGDEGQRQCDCTVSHDERVVRNPSARIIPARGHGRRERGQRHPGDRRGRAGKPLATAAERNSQAGRRQNDAGPAPGVAQLGTHDVGRRGWAQRMPDKIDPAPAKHEHHERRRDHHLQRYRRFELCGLIVPNATKSEARRGRPGQCAGRGDDGVQLREPDPQIGVKRDACWPR